MKLIVELTNIKLVKKYLKLNNINHLIVGYDKLSFNSFVKFNIDELKTIYELVKDSSVSLILNAERLFSDDDLALVRELIKTNFFEMFDYVMYSDFGFKNLLEEELVNIKYIFKASTYLTNYQDINEYNNLNDLVVASSEISSGELIELSKKVNKDIVIDLFGKSACFYSRRNLISNYFKYRGISNDFNKNNYSVVEELRDDFLPIIENEIGTVILEPKFHLLAEELEEIEHVSFGLIYLNNLNQKSSLIVVSAFNDLIETKDYEAFYSVLNGANIPYYKGAYNIKSVLLKGGSSNE